MFCNIRFDFGGAVWDAVKAFIYYGWHGCCCHWDLCSLVSLPHLRYAPSIAFRVNNDLNVSFSPI